MMKKLPNTKLLFLAIALIATVSFNAQNLVYDFDTNTQGWTAGVATGPWASAFAGNPSGELEMTYPADSKNAVMYAPDENGAAVGEIDADTYSYFKIIFSNESTEIDLLRIRTGQDDGAGGFTWSNAHEEDITTDAPGTYTTKTFQISHANYNGDVKFQVIFRNKANGALTDGSRVLIDQITLSDNTLSTNNVASKIVHVFLSNNTLSVPTPAKYQIMSITGAVVAQGEGSKSIPVSGLASGLYIYKTAEGFAKFVK
ncbi:hypothetical protein Q4566_04570 [Tamlana sp. 2_MG-2023]|uniref:hypothetical protein n=1 Tax=unclassified Tamlana TaxID=2614803 RepID=UPI0026E1FE69|nr:MULTISPECIES: hypothetical protein [unclassified Tamlana]MDO6759465.1 hypothetical protein [Tamlana sp. 2_MG-2023]MDO6790396.1 hypothetical protein [Tamlana sp. 1_MG-2023]